MDVSILKIAIGFFYMIEFEEKNLNLKFNILI
jgi:hypothetical protein